MNYTEINNWKREHTITVAVVLNKDSDADIISEIERRKEKYGTARSFTLRRWIRMGFKQDEDD